MVSITTAADPMAAVMARVEASARATAFRTRKAADAGGYALSGVAIFILFIAFAIRAAVRAIGRDVAAHDANMHVAERAESITGEG